MQKLRYFKTYKPYGVLSQFTDASGRTTLKDLFRFPPDTYPAGRLDYDSEGLLLLSNDKKLFSLVASPSSGTEKEYLVQVEGIPGDQALKKLVEGIVIEGRKTLPAKVSLIPPPDLLPRNPPVRYRKTVPDSWLKLVIREGRNRQVRKMTAAVGFPALRLVRIRIKNITLGGMNPGEVRELTADEIKGLISPGQNR